MEKTSIPTNCAKCNCKVMVRPSKYKPNNNYCSRSCFYEILHQKNDHKVISVCEVCSKGFHLPPSRKNKAKFCSHKCQGLFKRRKNKQCQQCGTSFRPRKNDSKFCSKECASTSQQRDKVRCNCKWCNKEIYKAKSNKSKSKFCTVWCANKWAKRNQVKINCEVCNKELWVSRSRYNNCSCCSKKCLQNLKINKVEKEVYSILRSFNLEVIEQHEINKKFVVDAYLPKYNTIIQVDGDYWHGNPCYYPDPNKMQRKNIARDKSLDKYLIKCGYQTIRIWESELKSNTSIIKTKLKGTINGNP